jgi:hypothetical protein
MQSYFGPRTLRAVASAVVSLSKSDKTHFNYTDIAEEAEYSPRSVVACMAYLLEEEAIKRERVYIYKGGAYYRYTPDRVKLIELGVLRDSA